MVFGWGKKKEEKKPESITSKKEIQLSEIPKVIENLTDLREKQLIAEISSFRNQTNPLIKELANIVKKLEKDDLKVDDVDKHLRIIVVRGKKQVISVIKKDTQELSSVSTYDDAVQVTITLEHMLKRIGDVLGRQTRVIHIFAKKYAAKLKDILENMNQNHKEMKDLIQNYDTTKEYSESILRRFNQITELKNVISNNLQKTEQISKSISDNYDKIKSIKDSIDKIKSSTDYKEFLKEKSYLDDIEIRKNSLKNEIDSEFTKISRPLNRYEYVSSLDSELKNLLSNLLKDPFTVMTRKNKDSIIIILENIRKNILSGTISVKDTDKTTDALTEIEESLDGFISKIQQINDQKQQINQKLDSMKPKSLWDLESSLESLNASQKELEEKNIKLDDEIQSASEHIPKLLTEIESELEKFSKTKYTITRHAN